MASHIGRRKFLATPQLMRDRVREHDARRGVQAWIRGYCVTRRQRDNLRAPAGKNRVGTDQQCTAGLLHEVCEGRIDLATSPSAHATSCQCSPGHGPGSSTFATNEPPFRATTSSAR